MRDINEDIKYYALLILSVLAGIYGLHDAAATALVGAFIVNSIHKTRGDK